VKALASIVTAAAVLIGADVFVRSSDRTAQPTVATSTQGKVVLHGGSGMPPPPPDAY